MTFHYNTELYLKLITVCLNSSETDFPDAWNVSSNDTSAESRIILPQVFSLTTQNCCGKMTWTSDGWIRGPCLFKNTMKESSLPMTVGICDGRVTGFANPVIQPVFSLVHCVSRFGVNSSNSRAQEWPPELFHNGGYQAACKRSSENHQQP